ncbi:MAG: presqualene diphosphate synthase HpnD [Burkholderiales bacterium]
MTPDQYCQDKAAKSGSSFYYAFLFLPPPRRRAITALYAYCREVDDVVDECTDADIAHTKLEWWRHEVRAIATGKAQHPVTRALAAVDPSIRLDEARLLEIIDGMEMDLTHARYADYATLERYCHLVAGVVGLLSAEIFGYTDPRTPEYAHELGLAFQLTNIVRDVGEDARRGRIYLPMEDLARFNVPAGDILQARETPAFIELMRFQVARAQATYTRAFSLLPATDRKAQRAGLMMAAIYRALLDEIDADGCRVLSHRTSLTPLRKLWLAWTTWIKG